MQDILLKVNSKLYDLIFYGFYQIYSSLLF